MITDLEIGRLCCVFQILRALADGGVWVKNIPLADACGTSDRNMTDQARATADLNLRTDMTEWPDFRIGMDDGAGINNRAGMNRCHLSTSPKRRIASETTSPFTRHRQEAFPSRFFALVSSHSMKRVSPGMTGLRNFTSSALMK